MKTLKIIQLILWLLIIAFLMTAMSFFFLGKVNFSDFIRSSKQIVLLQQTENINEITGITLDLSSTDVIIKPSASDDISITYLGPESQKNNPDIMVTVDQGELKIYQKDTRQFFFFNWNFSPKVLEISLPQSYADEFVLKNSSGDLTVSGVYELSAFTSRLTSGDCSLEDIICSDFSLNSTSGDVSIGRLEAEDLSISLISGRAEISSLAGSGSISCTSGYIDIGLSKAAGDLSVKTISGDVELSFAQEAVYLIDASCVSGKISSDYPLRYLDGSSNAAGDTGSSAQYKLKVHSISGDISLSSQQ